MMSELSIGEACAKLVPRLHARTYVDRLTAFPVQTETKSNCSSNPKPLDRVDSDEPPLCLSSEGVGVTLTLIFGSSHWYGSLARVPSPPPHLPPSLPPALQPFELVGLTRLRDPTAPHPPAHSPSTQKRTKERDNRKTGQILSCKTKRYGWPANEQAVAACPRGR